MVTFKEGPGGGKKVGMNKHLREGLPNSSWSLEVRESNPTAMKGSLDLKTKS